MKRARAMLTQDSARLRDLVRSCLAASYVTESSPAWEAFLTYLDDKVSAGSVLNPVATLCTCLYVAV